MCFVAGTLIYTETGLQPIETLAKGTKVYSFNFESGTLELREVTRHFKRTVNEPIHEIIVGPEQIRVTGEHPFYVPTRGWVKAKNLQPEDSLKASDQSTMKIERITLSQQNIEVFNIEVSGNHNYFVSASQLLVHNKNVSQINHD